jgi:hypothetical protein
MMKSLRIVRLAKMLRVVRFTYICAQSSLCVELSLNLADRRGSSVLSGGTGHLLSSRPT